MSKTKTKIYTVQVEDQIYRCARLRIEASSAAEAALIARRRAYQGKVSMGYQDHLREPAIYSVEGGDMPYTTGSNTSCLCDNVEQLLELEGLPKEMADQFGEYCDDTDETGYEGR